MDPNINPLQETIMKAKVLNEKYKEYMVPLRESLARKGKTLDPMMSATILTLLENMNWDMGNMGANSPLGEATKAVNVGSFIQHGYDLVTAIYPNLVSNVVASIQPLTYKTGEVWYYDLLYQTAKGFVSADDIAIGAKTGLRADKMYSSEFIEETPTGTVNGVNDTFTHAAGTDAINVGAGTNYFWATDGVEIFSVASATSSTATLVGDLGGTGTLTLANGQYSIAFNTAPASGSTLVVRRKISFEDNPSNIGKTKITLTSEPVTADKHALITDYSLDAEHDFARNFNMSMSDELIKGTAGLVRSEIDQITLDDIKHIAKSASGAGTTTWDGAIPTALSQEQHFKTFITTVTKQANDIYEATRMVFGNFIVCGNDVATLLEVLPGFQPNPEITSELQRTGPYVAGTIKNIIVIKNPYYLATEWVIGNRGAGTFNTGYVLAPYKGLMVTPPVSDVTNPFSVTRGLWTQLGRKSVNNKFYAYGTVTNLTL